MLVYEPRPRLSDILGLRELVADLDLELCRIYRYYDYRKRVPCWSPSVLNRCFTHDYYGVPFKKVSKQKQKVNVHKQTDDYSLLPFDWV